MKNNDILDEDYGRETPEPKQRMEAPFPIPIVGIIILACFTTIIVCLTVRLDRWILH